MVSSRGFSGIGQGQLAGKKREERVPAGRAILPINHPAGK